VSWIFMVSSTLCVSVTTVNVDKPPTVWFGCVVYAKELIVARPELNVKIDMMSKWFKSKDYSLRRGDCL